MIKKHKWEKYQINKGKRKEIKKKKSENIKSIERWKGKEG